MCDDGRAQQVPLKQRVSVHHDAIEVSEPELWAEVDADGDGELHVICVLHNNTSRPVEISIANLKLRDEDGRLMLVESTMLQATFRRVQELHTSISVGPGVVDAVHSIELWGDLCQKHRTALGTAELSEIPRGAERAHVPFRWSAAPSSPGAPAFGLDLSLVSTTRWSEPILRLTAELQAGGAISSSHELAASVRDADDELVTRNKSYVDDAEDGSPAWITLDLDLPNQTASPRTLQLVLLGEIRRRVHLATFDIKR